MRSIIDMINNIDMERYICTSFEEAESNSRKKNIVVIDNMDVYLTYKYDDVFGEFVCWVSDEFEEDESVYNAMILWVEDIYSRTESEIDNDILNDTFPLIFKPYEI